MHGFLAEPTSQRIHTVSTCVSETQEIQEIETELMTRGDGGGIHPHLVEQLNSNTEPANFPGIGIKYPMSCDEAYLPNANINKSMKYL
jgi:hypothetical protein